MTANPMPSVGRIVMYVQPADEAPLGGTRIHPAIICRLWSDGVVNLRILADHHTTPWVTSVVSGGPDVPRSWWWPPRV